MGGDRLEMPGGNGQPIAAPEKGGETPEMRVLASA
jgi:hypothetical protein